ncbi:Uncharacterised protein [Mycobacterium tuberculosis]|nr:Uncharacterised protein [Mycobacterium tuberculosis]
MFEHQIDLGAAAVAKMPQTRPFGRPGELFANLVRHESLQ